MSSPTFNIDANSSFPMSAFSDGRAESLVEAEVASKKHTKADKRISCREYYAYKFQIRPGNLLIRGGRLFQQFIVDMYLKIENTRLNFLRLNQEAIWADLYQRIIDTLELGENSACNVGKRIVLPPSFLGGPRDMRRRYLNEMALVQKYGKPDLFITITCNPNWPEIKSELSPGEQLQNRPDLVARVFHAKLKMLRKQIREKQIFGEVAAMINVVEFQKRGLPHAHFLIILKPGYKITSPKKFDKNVFAEIPSNDNPHIRAAVLKHMMHGPCGDDFPKNVCRDTGETVLVRKANIENRSAVPCNPYLLAMFDCHLNVEVCSTINAVKYLYKYVYKSHDRILFNVANGTASMLVDEIEKYQSGRWVSPLEAAWRIFGFNPFDTHPPVHPLPVHIRNGQTVRFSENEDLANVIANEERAKTMLTEYLKTNLGLQEGDRGVVIGRFAHASHGEGERYYLRLLLAHVRGPQSFEDIKTLDGVFCVSFQEATLKRGVLEQDNAEDMCMDEAVQVVIPNALRRQFPIELIRILQPTTAKVEQFLEGMGKTFRQFGLDHLHFEQEKRFQSTRDISDALNVPIPLLQLASRKELNVEQRTAYKAIIHHVKTGKAATSGIAASNLPTDRTTLPASMSKRENIEAVNMLFQDVCNSIELFGGKVIVFGGDFRQVLPVLPRRTQQEAVESSIVSSPIGPYLTKFNLTENIMAKANP
ncbi:uncharacterized protein LOC141618681 [Silene latifolia]|uniref:uncharacterized protein LOC141618681 n=1 Tax=Silene latifolia TaxID=37657 RepID=UPI003D77CD93